MEVTTLLSLIISSSILAAAPLILTALGGVFSERSGVVNIGLEGLMVVGAFSGILFNYYTADIFGAATPWISILVAMIFGGIFSLLHALASITFRADQVVSGVAINFLALGLTIFLVKKIFGKGQTEMIVENIRKVDIPFLSDIPIIGKLFFTNISYVAYATILLSFVAWYVIYKTPFGLRIRTVGEHPMAADTMGISVTRLRYIGVILSGVLGGAGGAVYAQSFTGNFSHTTITGQGFMALAAMIFGKWHPLGAMGGALFFGFAQSLSIVGSRIPILQNVPSVFLFIAPYVLTILALAGFIGRADAPKASGTPYIKGKR
ncbi:ABC transporter permease [Lederbergia wuyishanensis]|uniref:Simple sugar transport system permease protein n=1 Tax=Lederbergia wuyishanensis TaxID=1347903 RepID=A0ABU0CZW8_9BACI|nr:ABC transporter permease [Lederbergia wuyishanensis]MCJ8006329.1 ABC transporter permease [Lederbergia wuyishanensis]MDQ0341698.1 simple sugar transport system permease protein [Lederbergia wuyishanensis]